MNSPSTPAPRTSPPVRVDLDLAVPPEGIPAPARFQAWVEAALAGRRRHAEVAIRVVDEAESQALNRDYRGIDRPTNVLSFPCEALPGVPLPLLGNLAICAKVVADEAQRQHKVPEAHWAHMVVHGTLHLLGFDHQSEPEAEEMEGLEKVILQKLGFDDPYLDEQ